MHCPFCGHVETKVTDSRLAADGGQIRRRRECLSCGERFTTFETAELLMPRVIKSDGSREPFDERKLAHGMIKALEKRPVGAEAIEQAVSRICHKLRVLGEREVPARTIGELVMEELRHLDEVGYVRFASVYRSFQDVEAFRDEIERLRHHRRRREEKREPDQLPLLPGEATAVKSEVMNRLRRQRRHPERARHALHAPRAGTGGARSVHHRPQSARRLRAGARRARARRGLARARRRGARRGACAGSGRRVGARAPPPT